MKPWSIKSVGKKPADSFIIPLWEPYKPKDFYFAILIVDNITIVYIVPSEFYNSTGAMFNDSMPIIQHLPSYLVEILEGVYEVEHVGYNIVKQDLLNKGFVNNDFFQKYIERSHRYGPLRQGY